VPTDGTTWRLLVQSESGSNQKLFRARSRHVGSFSGSHFLEGTSSFPSTPRVKFTFPTSSVYERIAFACLLRGNRTAPPPEKKAAKLAYTFNHHTFSGPVSKEESPNNADFSQFPEQSRRISLHCRLYGGERGIRTLGTVLGPLNPRVCVVADSKNRAENFVANGQRLWPKKIEM